VSYRRQSLRAPVVFLALCSGVVLPGIPAFAAGISYNPAAYHPAAYHAPTHHPATHTTAPVHRRATHAAVHPVTHTTHSPVHVPVHTTHRVTVTTTRHATHAAPVATRQTTSARSGVARGGARPAPITAVATEHGIAMHYYPGLFETVARNRGMRLRQDVDGYTSRQNCSELGRIVIARLYSPRLGTWGPWLRLQVLDCSARRDVAHHRAIGLILEVDYNTAARTGFVYRGWTQAEVAK